MRFDARRLIALTLAFLLSWNEPIALALNSPGSSPKQNPDFNLTALQEYDPAIREFAQAPWVQPQFGPFEPSDPILDQDPFFMRSQSYQAPFNHEPGHGTAYRTGKGQIEIHLEGQSSALVIEQPLAPLFELEDFLFFQATDPRLFELKSATADAYGEGVFFLDKRYLITELRKNSDQRPVPIFFMPLDGRGWTGRIYQIALGGPTTVALRNESGESTTVDITQIRDLAKLLHNNVVMAVVAAAKKDVSTYGRVGTSPVEMPKVLPARGSTAVFGFFYTGLDLDRTAANGALDLLPKAHASDLLSPDVLDRLITVAQVTGTAFLAGWVAQHTILANRMRERRAYIELKEEELAARRGVSPPNRSSPFYGLKTELKETVDVFSHGLAALASGFGAATGFVLEYGADRFFGRPGRNGLIRKFLEKTFLYSRKQNELIGANWNTFFLGVVVLGGIDTASVVLQLLYVSPVFFPYAAGLFSDALRDRMIHSFSGADAATNNVLTSEIMRNLTGYFVHGAYSYSSTQRQALLEIVRPEVERQMANEHKDIEDPEFKSEFERRIEARLELMLVERGLPTNAEFLFSGPSLMRSLAALMGYSVDRYRIYNHRDYRRADGASLTDEERARLSERRDWQRRLSGRVDRLLDEASRYPENAAEVTRFRKASERIKRDLLIQIEKSYDTETFVLERARWGLLSHALKRAENAARELLSDHPRNENLQAAVSILAETKKKYHFVTETLKRPWRVRANAQDAFQVRKMLTLLSYDGPAIGQGVRYLDLWDAAATHPDGALIAARFFRQSLFALIQDKPECLKPTRADLRRFLPAARQRAREVLASASRETGFDETDAEIVALELVKEQSQRAANQAKAENWHPPDPDPLELAQRGHAHREAMIRVAERSNLEFERIPALETALASGNVEMINQFGGNESRMTEEAEEILSQNPDAVRVYREAYREELGNIVGLQTQPPESSELVRKVMDLADKEVQINVEKNPGWKEYLLKMDEVGRIRFLSHQYADSFLTKYVELTVSNSSSISLTSPEQPGFFQKLRNFDWSKSDSRSGRAIRTILRALESPMDNTAYRPGLSNWLRRNIPWYQDAKTDVQLTFRIMWTSLTVGYLVQYYIWQVKFTWPTALFFLFTGGITTIVHYWTDRLMMNTGVRPMSDTWSKVKYSLLYTWLTYPSYLPFIFWYEDFAKFWSRWVSTPLLTICEKILSSVF